MTARDDAERMLSAAGEPSNPAVHQQVLATIGNGHALLAIADAIDAAVDKIVATPTGKLTPDAYEAAVQVVALATGWSADGVRARPREALHTAELHAIGKPDDVRDGIVEARIMFARLGLL